MFDVELLGFQEKEKEKWEVRFFLVVYAIVVMMV